MQDVNFSSVDDFLEYLPEHERAMVDVLREIVMESIPEASEKLAYNVPYYYRHSRVCFIWPASVPWGKVKLNGVQLGFCNGHLIDDGTGYLERGDRKQVLTKTFTDPSQIDIDMIRSYLFDAVGVDEQLHQERKSRGRR